MAGERPGLFHAIRFAHRRRIGCAPDRPPLTKPVKVAGIALPKPSIAETVCSEGNTALPIPPATLSESDVSGKVSVASAGPGRLAKHAHSKAAPVLKRSTGGPTNPATNPADTSPTQNGSPESEDESSEGHMLTPEEAVTVGNETPY